MSTSLKDFQILNKLGEGSFSQVYKVKRISDSKEYALKKVKLNSLSSKEKDNALNEVRILASIQCPYIISYKEAFHEESTNCLCIIMEYAEKGDILGRINKCQKTKTAIPEPLIWQVVLKKGLKKLHQMKIVHRDLKCANIFIGKDNVNKIGDLNVSKVAKYGLIKTQTGTPYYCSPEVWSDQPYDSKCDIWSLGCIIYEMAALKPPFRANDMKGLYQKIMKGNYESIPSSYSQDLSIIIKQLLKVNPKNRPSSEDLLTNSLILKNCEIDQQIQEINIELLNTIKMPHNAKLLKEKLPSSQYDTRKSTEKLIQSEIMKSSDSCRINSSKQNKENKNYRNYQLDLDNNIENKNNKPPKQSKPPINPRQNYQKQNIYLQEKKQDDFKHPEKVKLPKIDQSPSHNIYESGSYRNSNNRALSYNKQNSFDQKQDRNSQRNKYPSLEKIQQYLEKDIISSQNNSINPIWWG